MRRVYLFFIALCFLNFFAFMFGAWWFGGDAINGGIVNGRYFLREHSEITEVSRKVFMYSKWHAISLCFTHPMGMLSGWLIKKLPGSRTSIGLAK